MTDPRPDLASITLPLRIKAGSEAFIIRDAADRLILAVYFDDGPEVRRQVRQRLTREEAKAAAQVTARALTEAVERAKNEETRTVG